MERALAFVFVILLAFGIGAVWIASRGSAPEEATGRTAQPPSDAGLAVDLSSPGPVSPPARTARAASADSSPARRPAVEGAVHPVQGAPRSRERVTGRVVRAGGAPVARAEVVLEGEEPFRSALAPLGKTRTSGDGTFELACLGSGPFRVQAFEHEGRRITGQAAIEGVFAGRTGLEIVLSSCVVQGLVVDDLGRAVTKFRLGWTPLTAGVSLDSGWAEKLFRTESGAFSETLTPGSWSLGVTPLGDFVATSRELVVPMAESLTVVVARKGTARGVVVDPRGKAVEGARLFSAQVPVGKSKPDGSFEVKLAPGAVSLTAEAEGFATSAPCELSLAGGEERSDVVLRLEPSAHLEGEVIGLGGMPVAGREVSILRQDGPMFSGVAGSPCRTDSSGRFALDVPPGRLHVQVELVDDELRTLGREEAKPGSSRPTCVRGVTVEPGESAAVRLVLGGSPVRLYGRVELGGKLQSGALVRTPGGVRARMSPDGGYEMLVPEPGVHLVLVTVGNFSLQQHVDVPEVAEWRHDVSFPVGRLSGHVRSEAGSPLEGVTVDSMSWGDVPHRSSGRAVTDRDGAYSMGLLTGTYRVVPREDFEDKRSFGEPEPQLVTVESSAERTGVDFTLRTVGAIEGVVRRQDGGILTGARVSIRDSTGHERRESAVAGRFHVPLEGGRYWVSAAGSAEAAAFMSAEPFEVVLASGATQQLDLCLVPCTVVRVRLLDSGGAALVAPFFVRLEAIDARGRAFPSRPDDRGVHTLLLLAGPYVVRALRDRLFERSIEVPEGRRELEIELRLE